MIHKFIAAAKVRRGVAYRALRSRLRWRDEMTCAAAGDRTRARSGQLLDACAASAEVDMAASRSSVDARDRSLDARPTSMCASPSLAADYRVQGRRSGSPSVSPVGVDHDRRLAADPSDAFRGR